jgi:hypothetical protein
MEEKYIRKSLSLNMHFIVFHKLFLKQVDKYCLLTSINNRKDNSLTDSQFRPTVAQIVAFKLLCSLDKTLLIN